MSQPRRRPSAPRLVLIGAALALSLAATGTALAGPEEDARAHNAVRVLTEIQAIPESAIPDKLLDEARAIVVVPDTIKAGLVLGGRRGHGLMAVKSPDGTWSQPSFVTLTGGSIGFQVGVQSADVVLVFRNDRSLESVVNGKFTLGADAGVAAGPLGRNASTATDGQLKAEIWSWSRARGLFAGVALDGAVLSIDDDANQAVYGQGTTPRMIFEGRAGQAPSNAVVDFRDRLEEATAIARANRGTATAPAAVAHASAAVTVPAGTQALPQPPADAAAPMPQPFEPVAEGEIRSEPLDDTP
ncbi:lipid-binding SYLF domain-containing protein [Luteimonas sp. RD2P54]|uniref:Lipid-binding SYLF domain-containing protein n=1 Tax=Luteimonas endophytica TaxID=3042023 RepID=A0ABT6J5G8_9GAMM|nr:lipid-binding SYLF domain-containing protein [Luteimonas endophytica]MDH5822051.1 lipid-binding SYLF domain-containing protein [Luteimonas endophytica]